MIISHDHHFLDTIVPRLIEIKNHIIKEYEGNYPNYLEKREVKQEVIFK